MQTPTLAPVGEIQPLPAGFVYLEDQEKLAVGFNMSAGGQIGSLLFNSREPVDHSDYGRYMQLSFYDGRDQYEPLGNHLYRDWGWNPIQAGSKAVGSSLVGAKVLEYWAANNQYDQAKLLTLPIVADGQFHSYSLDMSSVRHWQDRISQVRLDSTDRNAAIACWCCSPSELAYQNGPNSCFNFSGAAKDSF